MSTDENAQAETAEPVAAENAVATVKPSMVSRVIGVVMLLCAILMIPPVLGPLVSSDGHIGNPGNQLILWVVASLVAVAAIPFLRGWKPKLGQVIGLSISTIMTLFLFEVAMRVYAAMENAGSIRGSMQDDSLGWRNRADFSFNADIPGFGQVTYTAGQDGFRRWGHQANNSTENPVKILVLGDSFTQALTVTDGEPYYDRLAKTFPNTEWYVHGCGGYGSLQSYMILDRYFDTIQPDLIIWQFCSNDVINNDNGLERQSVGDNNLMTRPYFEGDDIAYRFPGNVLVAKSHLFRRLHLALQNKQDAPPVAAGLERSLATTARIAEKVQGRIGNARIIAFEVDRPSWLGDGFETLARAAGWQWAAGIPDAVEQAAASGMVINGMPHDGHWNGNGHGVAATALSQALIAHSLLPTAVTSP